MRESTERRAAVIANPAAGSGRAKKLIPKALEDLRAAGFALDVAQTERRGHATELARELFARGHRRFIGIGGDGTVHEIVEGLVPLTGPTNKVAIGCLPLGTGNSFLRDFGVNDSKTALERIVRGTDRDTDVVRVVHKDGILHSLNLVSVGFSADANTRANRKYKRFGTFGYVLAVLETTVGLKTGTFPFSTDRAALDSRAVLLLSFSNSRCTGGAMQIAPPARVDDGELDIIRISPMSRATLLRAFPSLFSGEHILREDVEATRAKRVDFDLQGRTVDCIVDGEVYPLALRSLEVLPAAIQVTA